MSIVGRFGVPPQTQITRDRLDELPTIFVLYTAVVSGGRQTVETKAVSTDKHKLDTLGKLLLSTKKCLDYRVSSVAYVPTSISSESLSDYV